MIRRLRWKFVLINMVIVTVMLSVILGLVYHFTRRNIESDSINMMQNIANQPFGREALDKPKEGVRLPYFSLQIGQDGELEATGGGYYDLSDEEFLKELAQKAFDSRKNPGVIEEYNLRYYYIVTPLFQRVVFADISNELTILQGLMRVCFFIGALSFFAFLWISALLSQWAVRPVDLAWKQQRQFVGDASHELKTPLTVIMTNAELLQGAEYDKENQARFLDNILAMSRQMRRLIEQMLELARTDNAHQKPGFSEIAFDRLIEQAVLPFEPVFFEKGLGLTAEIEPDVWVRGDLENLKQVVEILLDNAQKYTKDRGKVWVTLKRRGRRQCVLSVCNEGEEIAPEELKNIFKRFYRADKARGQSASFGLGLSIAENIVVRHKGKMWAESSGGVNGFFVKILCK